MAKKYLAILVAAVAALSASVTALAINQVGMPRPGTTIGRSGTPANALGTANTMVGVASAPMTDAVSSSSAAYPNIASFQPGPPPFGGQAGGDGLSAYGVAYKEVPAPAPGNGPAQAAADPDLIHAAYADALKRAQALAAGSGVGLGKLLALSDYAQEQPFFKSCPVPVPLPGKPVPGAPGVPTATGGSSGSGVASVAPEIAPACTPHFYLVVWVLARYQLG